MKYAKELDKILSQYSWYDRLVCISYRKWKKKKPTDLWKLSLLFEFLMTPKRLIELNLKTLYKICKRFEKRFGIEARCFYTRVSKMFSHRASETLI